LSTCTVLIPYCALTHNDLLFAAQPCMLAYVTLSLAFVLIAVTHAFQGMRPVRMTKPDRFSMQAESKSFSEPALKLALGLLGAFMTTVPVDAANYGGFGYLNSEVIGPTDAVFNDEMKDSADVKQGRIELQTLLGTVTAIKTDLTENPQLDLKQRIKDDFTIAKVRSTLNKYNGAFSEDTQRSTDRLIRKVIQVLTTPPCSLNLMLYSPFVL
jgi:hypothetical protein